MKVYCGKNKDGLWEASLNYDTVSKLVHLIETELPIVHDKVYLIEIYHGYDYNYGSQFNTISSVYKYSTEVFNSVSQLKECSLWNEREKLAKQNPAMFHVTDFSIASDDYGEPFEDGDVMDGKFNMEIISVEIKRG